MPSHRVPVFLLLLWSEPYGGLPCVLLAWRVVSSPLPICRFAPVGAAVSAPEARARLAELQKLRTLESYFHARCARIHKIKSKNYHRIRNKLKRRAEAGTADEELPSEAPEVDDEEATKAERTRAQERMSLRHKNQSKWVKTMLARRDPDPESRQVTAADLSRP